MAIGENIRQLLVNTALTMARVATDKTDQDLPLPYMVLTQLHEDYKKTLDGTSGMRQAEFDIDCVASSRPKADDLADAAEAFMKDFTGKAGANKVLAVLMNDRAYDCIPIGQGTEDYKFVTTLNLEIQYE